MALRAAPERSARPPLNEGGRLPLPLVVVQCLSSEKNPRRADVVSDIDEQQCEVPASVEKSREHDEPADLAEQRWNRRGALSDETRYYLRQEQEKEHGRHELEQLGQVAEPGVWLEVGRSHRHGRIDFMIARGRLPSRR